MWEGVKVVSRMSEEGLESLDENESKMDGRQEVGQNSSVDDLMRRLEVYKVVHTQRGTVEFIINDRRHGVPKGTAEREKHASEYKKKMEDDMKKKLEEASNRHAKEMEAKEIEWRAELKEASARFEKEIKGKLQAIEKESKG